MSSLPSVEIIKGNGQIGGVPISSDGTTLLVISAPAAYPTPSTTVFLSREDAETAGITEAADKDNDCLVWEHVKDFYTNALDGTELHIVLLPDSATFVDVFAETEVEYLSVQTYLKNQAGSIKILGVALNPANPALSEAHTEGITLDLENAIPLAQAFQELEFSKFRPVEIILEGRKLVGNLATAPNLRTKESNQVSLVVGRERARRLALATAGNAVTPNYAQLGYALGVIASLPVQRNIGRVKNGALLQITDAELSGSQSFESLSESSLDALNQRGYIFYIKHPNKTGFYYNDSHTAVALTDDYNYIERNRVINKIARITHERYTEELLDEIAVDPTTGQLSPAAIQNFRNTIVQAVEQRMEDTGEIVAGSTKVDIDPKQDVITTSEIEVVISAIPFGTTRKVTATIQLRTN